MIIKSLRNAGGILAVWLSLPMWSMEIAPLTNALAPTLKLSTIRVVGTLRIPSSEIISQIASTPEEKELIQELRRIAHENPRAPESITLGGTRRKVRRLGLGESVNVYDVEGYPDLVFKIPRSEETAPVFREYATQLRFMTRHFSQKVTSKEIDGLRLLKIPYLAALCFLKESEEAPGILIQQRTTPLSATGMTIQDRKHVAGNFKEQIEEDGLLFWDIKDVNLGIVNQDLGSLEIVIIDLGAVSLRADLKTYYETEETTALRPSSGFLEQAL